MKKIKRLSVIFLTVIFLSSLISIPVHALDPVSAATISNAFAQAITAYGASNGVSLTFDGIEANNVSDIGRNMHELWVKFRNGQQTADDWDTLAASIFPGLYSKAINAAGNAIVAINIADTYLPDIDQFWNWVLSGPAEMVKVDNAYQWNTDNDEIVEPVILKTYDVSLTGNLDNYISPFYFSCTNTTEHLGVAKINNDVLYACAIKNVSYYEIYFIGPVRDTRWSVNIFRDSNNSTSVAGTSGYYLNDGLISGLYYKRFNQWNLGSDTSNILLPVFNSISDAINSVSQSIVTDTGVNAITVMPYVGDAVAKPVPIPDTSEPDYGPLPYIGNLPIPWNDTLYGDGTGTLTDTQSQAITDAIDDSIVDSEDKTLEIEREQTLPDNPTLPNEVYIPFLPVTLPEFNFSLSGIWHYVREWVSSLGAWFSLVFTVWSNLPYALVVPVYASAVIVIVLGVYKRFFM